MDNALLNMKRGIGVEDVKKAMGILQKYKQAKANLETRIQEDERWWKLQHWDVIRNQALSGRPEPTSAWLFNALNNKHADASDNFPEPVILPREPSDEQDAKTLTEILPVILEHNEFEETNSMGWWDKLKHGTAIYGTFWNKEKENGLGDIDNTLIDVLNVFWEGGIRDIQKSRNLFIVDLQDNDLLEKAHPELKGKLQGGNEIVAQYNHDDTVDVSGKSPVIDWYYKVPSANGRTLVHYCKFVGEAILFASENDEQYTERGYYDHGLYPLEFDVLFPEKDSPCGFGYIAITKDPQLYIDKLGQGILENTLMASKARYFVREGCNVNEADFADWSKALVPSSGMVTDEYIKPIVVPPLAANVLNVYQMKIEELKETSANRDVSQGSVSGGVTAAAAIAALQEAGNKSSRDMIIASYRSFSRIIYLNIELIRQFYDEERMFRITAPDGEMQFTSYSNKGIKDQEIPAINGVPAIRRPIFDVKIKAQRKNPFSRMSQNELAKELYRMGFFNPEQAQASMIALEAMDFEGKDAIMAKVKEGQILFNVLQQQRAEMDKMAQIIQAVTGTQLMGDKGGGGLQKQPPAMPTMQSNMDGAIQNSQRYGEALAENATPKIE